MTANGHPLSSDLLVALHEPEQAASTLEHLEECLACRVRISRLRQASGLTPPSDDSLQRIMDASTPLPDILSALVSTVQDTEPQPNEIWRVGRSEALLVWVRQVFDDGVADVVPLVLDVDLADQETVLVDANATPLGTETAAMVALRTHVHVGTFLNKFGILDITNEVNEVIAATREGRRPSRVRVGAPIEDDNDQRLEYRQALRDLLADLSPSAWPESQEDPEPGQQQMTGESIEGNSPDDIDVIKSNLGERLSRVQCRDVPPCTVAVGTTLAVTSTFKTTYLDTTVLVALLQGANLTTFPDTEAVAAACQRMTLIEMDVDAVAIAIPQGEWPTILFTAAHMRDAFVLPSGVHAGPTATLEGYGLVDTLCKHLEGAMPAWEITEPTTSRIHTTDIHEVAARHATIHIEKIAAQGSRARQPAKRTAWGSLPAELDDKVARFIIATVNRVPIDDALAELALEKRDD